MRTGRLSVAVVLVAVLGAGHAQASVVHPSGHERTATRSVGRVARVPHRPSSPVLSRNVGALRASKAAARGRFRRVRRSSPRASSSAAPPAFGGLSKPGLAAPDALFAAPPDTTGSIGPGFYVEEVNDGIAVFRRSDLARVAGPLPNELFMRSPFPTFVSDPQLQWDQQGGRWVYLALSFTVNFQTLEPSGPNYLLFGFSKTSDPTDLASGWCHYSLASGSAPDGEPLLDDYPKLGHDDRRLVFASNVFGTGPGQPFETARIWSVPKPAPGALTSCPPAPVATSFGSAQQPLRTAGGKLAFTPVPANTLNSSTGDYVVAADDPTSGAQSHLMAWQLSGAASSPSLTADGEIPVASYAVPRPARDFIFPGIDTLDGRLTMAVANADPTAGGREAVWTTHTVDPGDGTVAMRWYELLPDSLRARQIGTVAQPGADIYNGSISPTANGSAALVDYNRSGVFLLPELDARAHLPAMPGGITGPSVVLATSGAPDFDLSCAPVCRWGDYSGASPDPTAPSAVWVAGQTISPPGGLFPSWSTHIARLTPGTSRTPPG